MPIEKNHYICIPAIDIDSVLKIDKKAFPQAYLEQCKYKLKKRKPLNLLILKLLIMIVMMIIKMMMMKMKMMIMIMMIMNMILLHLGNHKNYDYF